MGGETSVLEISKKIKEREQMLVVQNLKSLQNLNVRINSWKLVEIEKLYMI